MDFRTGLRGFETEAEDKISCIGMGRGIGYAFSPVALRGQDPAVECQSAALVFAVRDSLSVLGIAFGKDRMLLEFCAQAASDIFEDAFLAGPQPDEFCQGFFGLFSLHGFHGESFFGKEPAVEQGCVRAWPYLFYVDADFRAGCADDHPFSRVALVEMQSGVGGQIRFASFVAVDCQGLFIG